MRRTAIVLSLMCLGLAPATQAGAPGPSDAEPEEGTATGSAAPAAPSTSETSRSMAPASAGEDDLRGEAYPADEERTTSAGRDGDAADAESAEIAALETRDRTYGPTAGDREITLAGTGSSDKDFDRSTFGVSGSFGKYFTDNWLISLRQGVNYMDVPGDNQWNGSTRVAADYHFDFGAWRPFIGAHVGYIYGENVEESGIAGPELGVKYFVKPETFVFAQTEYQFLFDDVDDVDDGFSDGAYAHVVGIGFTF